MLSNEMRLKLRIALLRRLQHEMPLLAIALFPKMPEERPHRADDMTPGRESVRDCGLRQAGGCLLGVCCHGDLKVGCHSPRG